MKKPTIAARLINDIAEAQRNARREGHAYRMGYDCAVNGANETNCNFVIFSTPGQTKEWERGKRDGSVSAEPQSLTEAEREQRGQTNMLAP